MSGDFKTPMRELTQLTLYPVIHVSRCAGGELLMTWDEFLPNRSGCHRYVVLPAQYARFFSPSIMSSINDGTKSVHFQLIRFSDRGFPLIQFYGCNMLRYGSMAIRFEW